MNRRTLAGIITGFATLALVGVITLATTSELYFSYDKNGQDRVTRIREGDAIWIVNLLRDAGLVKSGGEARRKIAAGAVRIDGEKITDPSHEVPFVAGKEVLLRLGREFRKIELRR